MSWKCRIGWHDWEKTLCASLPAMWFKKCKRLGCGCSYKVFTAESIIEIFERTRYESEIRQWQRDMMKMPLSEAMKSKPPEFVKK